MPMSIMAAANHTVPGRAKHAHEPGNATSHAEPISFVAFDATVASLCAAMGALIACLACYTYRRRMPRRPGEENEYRRCGATWTFAEVEAATDGFSPGRLLGRGCHGGVYRAIFPDGRVLAAKRIDPALVLRGAGFAAEAKALARARHPNAAAVVGYCEAPGERILVTEFMPRRSLQYHLHEGGVLFDWSHRLRIALQAAQGIEYLHEGTAPPILHGHVKPSNVLLDATWSARVTDFGLAFLAPGAVGYLDPECCCAGLHLGKPADVYAFGVVLLEILSGRRCFAGRNHSNYIVDWAVPLIAGDRAPEVFDRRLRLPADPRPLVRMAGLAAACVRKTRRSRPTMLEVVAVLKSIEAEMMGASYLPPQAPLPPVNRPN